MKKLALLLFALPLAACATPQQVAQMREEQYTTAETHCRADNVGPSEQYEKCVEDYLVDQYGVTLYRASDGTLKVTRYPTVRPWPSPDATEAFAAPPMSVGPPTTPPPGR